MIHQHIYAAPRPGMSEAEFQDYWLNVHAVRYAVKIPQIAKYRLAMRVPCSIDRTPIWSGCAEIWLRNDAEQIASLQTPEFLQGARLDEPNWAAFWMTAVLDCETQTVLDGPAAQDGVKLLVLSKRNLSQDVATYRMRRRAELDNGVSEIPGLLRCDLAFARDGLYAVGESRFDEVAHYWFASVASAEAAFASKGCAVMLPKAAGGALDPRQVFPMLTKEYWRIGPGERGVA